jgi:hypothetical protein
VAADFNWHCAQARHLAVRERAAITAIQSMHAYHT